MELNLHTMNKWDRRFFQLCNLAASWSEDQSRKVGAVIVGPDNEVRSLGFNGFARGVSAHHEDRHSRANGEKYFWFEHAERNAIYNAARVGISVGGCRIYTSLFPCADCTRAIIQSGIIQLNTFNAPDADETFMRSFEVSILMLSEARIEIRNFKSDGTVDK